MSLATHAPDMREGAAKACVLMVDVEEFLRSIVRERIRTS
jgi:hypothetical protein